MPTRLNPVIRFSNVFSLFSTRFITRDKELQKIYFIKQDPFPKNIRTNILYNIKRSSPQEKLRQFLQCFDQFYYQVDYQGWLVNVPFGRFFSNDTAPLWKWAVYCFSLAINSIMLVGWRANLDDIRDSNFYTAAWYKTAILPLSYLHVLLSILTATRAFLNKSSNIPYYAVFAILSILGCFFSNYFFAFHLLDVVSHNEILKGSIEAITKNGRALLNVTLLSIILIYIYSIIAFAFFRQDYHPDDGLYCTTLYECFSTTLTSSLTQGHLSLNVDLAIPSNSSMSPYASFSNPFFVFRLIYDMSFWVLITVISLNLVLGIIVDTFSQLREERAIIKHDTKNNCFICSLAEHEFEYVGGFVKHVKQDHNMWNYVAFMMYLNDLDITEMSFHELYLFNKLLEEKDTVAFPLKRSRSLVKPALQEEALTAKLDSRITLLEQNLQARFEKLDRTIASALLMATGTN